jgi:hypothetical protein
VRLRTFLGQLELELELELTQTQMALKPVPRVEVYDSTLGRISFVPLRKKIDARVFEFKAISTFRNARVASKSDILQPIISYSAALIAQRGITRWFYVSPKGLGSWGESTRNY